MKIITKMLKLLLFGSLFFGVSASAAYSGEFFAIKVNTDNAGSSDNNQFTLPINPDYTYNYNIMCDDNNHSNKYLDQNESTTCTYSTAGTYTVLVAGAEDNLDGFPAIYFSHEGDKEKILEVLQWGTGKWKSMKYAFWGASNLTVTAIDNPDLSELSDEYDMYRMFQYATSLTFKNSINDWNVSSATHMDSMFLGASNFNQDIGAWDVSNVKDMDHMFLQASNFNQDIGDWNVSKVEYMEGMFALYNGASSFNQDIGDWDVSSVIVMSDMFKKNTLFNHDIGDWDVSSVKYMSSMFEEATSFNQDIGDWDVSSVIYSDNLKEMFTSAHLSISNYDNLLNSWSKLDLVDAVAFDAGSSDYCQGEDARTLMMSGTDDSWTFTDGLKKCEYYIITPNEVTIKSGETFVMSLITNHDEGEYEPTTHYYIEGGADDDKFSITLRGTLSFENPQDANNPTDRNSDNIYRVRVKAVDNNFVDDYQTIKVRVVPATNGALVPTIMYLLN